MLLLHGAAGCPAPSTRRLESRQSTAACIAAHGGSHRRAQRCSSLRVACSQARTTGRPRTPESLRDPAHIGTTASRSVKVKELPGYTLESYMRLPVAQYYELDPAMIKPLGGDRFQLLVPRVQLLNVFLEPSVEVSVRGTAERVVIEAVDCTLRGSDMIESFGLNERFVLCFCTELTWDSPAARAPPAAAALQPPPQGGTIYANLTLDVWCEMVPPFTLIPRDALERTGDAVMGSLTAALLPLFMQKLADDYSRWATDPAYRARRAAQEQRRQQPAGTAS